MCVALRPRSIECKSLVSIEKNTWGWGNGSLAWRCISSHPPLDPIAAMCRRAPSWIWAIVSCGLIPYPITARLIQFNTEEILTTNKLAKRFVSSGTNNQLLQLSINLAQSLPEADGGNELYGLETDSTSDVARCYCFSSIFGARGDLH